MHDHIHEHPHPNQPDEEDGVMTEYRIMEIVLRELLIEKEVITPALHNVVVCTVCSCYPWPLLGLPPDWYKSRSYRANVVRVPRDVLPEFGTVLPDDVEISVHDGSADMRYLVMPMRPKGTQGWSEAQLAALITRDSMIGITQARPV